MVELGFMGSLDIIGLFSFFRVWGKEIPHIFTGFSTSKRKGLGLGLAITKKNVSELGGIITVESEEGRGSTFTLIFPSLS